MKERANGRHAFSRHEHGLHLKSPSKFEQRGPARLSLAGFDLRDPSLAYTHAGSKAGLSYSELFAALRQQLSDRSKCFFHRVSISNCFY